MKTENGENKSQKRITLPARKKALLIVTSLALSLAVLFGLNLTLGWLSLNKDLGADDLTLNIKPDAFEIYVASGDRTDFPANDPILARYQSGYQLWQQEITSTSRLGALCVMTNEAPSLLGVEGAYPGAYGTITFDVVPRQEIVSVVFTVSFLGLEEAGGLVVDTTPDSAVGKLMSGHVLLFESRSPISGTEGPYYYEDRVDGEYTFTLGASPDFTDAHGDHYTVTLYWVWPATLDQMIMTQGDPRLHSHSIFSPSNTAGLSELEGSMIADNDRFFYNMNASYLGKAHADFDLDYPEFCDGYNNADQQIGESVRYLAALFEGTAMGE